MTEFHPCVVIPIYNHKKTIADVVESLNCLKIPVLIVDDASNSATQNTLAELALKNSSVEILTHRENSGKGAAVSTGLLAAYKKGFTHGLQVDADGQHFTQDAGKFIEAAKNKPEALVLGKPLFDKSAPKSRIYGRKITHIFVWIETFSFEIKDTLCGFRVYPLQAFQAVSAQVNLRKRMDFDPEIAVRLYWEDVPVINIETPVRYFEGGLSNFHFIRDNGMMISLHVSLLLGALRRSLRLIQNAVKRNFR
jgi:glycosyltransferase involved in cell wall biosynthesis